MNKVNILKSLVISILISVGIKLTYGVENIYILGSINLSFFILSNIILNIENKDTKNELKRIEELTNNRINEMETNIVLAINSSNEKLSTINKELCNQGKELMSLKDSSIFIKEELNEINNKFSIWNEKLDDIKSIIKNQINYFDKINENLEKQIDNEENMKEDIKIIINSANVQIDKLMDINKVLKSLEEKNNDILDELENEIEEIRDIKEEIDNTKSSINKTIQKSTEESIKKQQEILDKYDIIQKAFVKEVANITLKTNHTVDLLNDSYKVLNEICSTSI